jgi:isopentenyl diphosphate isomerase/L-lactate dehydrogenase-like FMN-dependent dehydrogenase
MPLGISPTGIVGLVYFEGEIAAARAAAKMGVPYSLSTASITSLEAVARHAEGGDLWFQVYVWNKLDLTLQLIQRVADAGYSALIITTDGAGGTNREYNYRNQFTVPMKVTPKATLDVLRRPGWLWSVMVRSLASNGVPTFANYPEEYRADVLGRSRSGQGMGALGNPVVSRDTLRRIRDKWKGPLLVKGILSVEDAIAAVECGVDGVIVSNHGGRTLDSAVPAIDALPAIVGAVGGRVEVLMDSGVRRGSDVVKALALGAKFVMSGRAPIWGTAVAGEAGAQHALTIVKTEINRIMVQLGCREVGELGPHCLWTGAEPAVNAGRVRASAAE